MGRVKFSNACLFYIILQINTYLNIQIQRQKGKFVELYYKFSNAQKTACSTLLKGCELYKDKVSVLFCLNKHWEKNEPKETKIECDSFVLSICLLNDNVLVGLNNGCLQGMRQH